MKTEILESSVEFFERTFDKPLRLSSGAITNVTEARASVRVRVEGREAAGRGAIYLSDLWAWPDPALTHAFRDGALRELCRRIASDLRGFCGGGADHPLELGLRLHGNVCSSHSAVATELARAMCASPFDAALHDAAGIAIGRPAFDFYDQDVPLPHGDRFFGGGSAAAAIRAALRPRRRELHAWWIVGPGDSLGDEFEAVVRSHGYQHFKLKVLGRDNRQDVARTIEVFRAALAAGVKRPRLSLDSNEANPDAAAVLDYLTRLRAIDAEAFAALQYLEQPTSRDLRRHRHDWHEVAALKPVMLDEGLTSLDLLPEAQASGWSGLALKTCKGHSFTLVAAAWAHEHGMLLSMQDLTNPGLAAIHSALFASRLETLNGVELNSMQFTPAANADWLPRLSELLEPSNGVHRLPAVEPPGLGSML